MASKELAKTSPSKAELAKVDFGDDTGKGYEGQTQDDMLIPFISIIEKGSPEIEENPAAKPGMLFNTVTKELFKEVHFIPAKTSHVYVEWRKLTEGGGFVGLHALDSAVVEAAKERAEEWNKLESEDGKHEYVETYYLYGLIIDGTDVKGPAVLSMSSTRIKEYRRINTVLKTFLLNGSPVPMFANRLKITTKAEKKDKWSWFTFVLNPLNGDLPSSLVLPGSVLYDAAKGIGEAVEAGLMTAAFDSQAHGNVDKEETKPPF